MNRNKFYITTPIYYPNAKPHVGTLYSTLLADTIARWQRLLGKKVFFLTGLDEHGQKIQEKADSVSMVPKAYLDTIVPAYKQAWKLYNVSYDRFIRTTEAEHQQGVIAWINQMIKQGDIYKSTYVGWYCVPDETFVNVGSESIKDEQGRYLCPSCNRPLKELEEESYFFRLSAYEDQLLKFYEEHPDFVVPKERLNEIISFVKSGLKDLSISRKSVRWGIPFPGDSSHTVYVWADALTNYLTGVGYGQTSKEAQAQYAMQWPADVQVMAKDIFRFHAVYWPAFLMAAQLPLPKKLLVHGYILAGDQKMSKSLGNAIDPEQLAAWYGVDAVRYYLLRQMPITQDGTFDLKDLEERVAGDLANNLGNLLSRVSTLALANGLATVKPAVIAEPSTIALKERCGEAYRLYWDEMNRYHIHAALSQLWKFISEVNAYFQSQKPWELAKNNKELFAEVVSATCHSLHAIGVMLSPVMPQKMETLLHALGMTLEQGKDYDPVLRDNHWQITFTLSKLNEPLFIRPESHVVVAAQEQSVTQEAKPVDVQNSEIAIEDFAKVQLAVGTVVQAEPLANSDKLLKLQIDFGPLGKRQILAGVALKVKPEQLIGKQGVFVLNLKPRKMMGEMSQGMMLYASDELGNLQPLTVPQSVQNGARIK